MLGLARRPHRMSNVENEINTADNHPRTVAIVLLGLGLILALAAPCLSAFSLVAVFMIGSSPGVVIGYGKCGWRASITYAVAFGMALIVALVVFVQVFGR
jgi:hypothetical protein